MSVGLLSSSTIQAVPQLPDWQANRGKPAGRGGRRRRRNRARGEIGFGAGALALPPREAVGEAKHLAISEAARFVALQDDAAAARHQRDVVELQDQRLSVITDQCHRIAVFGLRADPGDGLVAIDDEAVAIARRDQQNARRSDRRQSQRRCLRSISIALGRSSRLHLSAIRSDSSPGALRGGQSG
jgi:hypothetical protein